MGYIVHRQIVRDNQRPQGLMHGAFIASKITEAIEKKATKSCFLQSLLSQSKVKPLNCIALIAGYCCKVKHYYVCQMRYIISTSCYLDN